MSEEKFQSNLSQTWLWEGTRTDYPAKYRFLLFFFFAIQPLRTEKSRTEEGIQVFNPQIDRQGTLPDDWNDCVNQLNLRLN